MAFKERFHQVADNAKEAVSGVKKVYEEGKEMAGKAKDKVLSLNVDLDSARQDKNFEWFLRDTGKKFHWEKDQADIKEAYVVYERAVKITEKYQNLFEDKLKGIAKPNSEISAEIQQHIRELAKNDPESLRKLEKQIDQVSRSEKMISDKQKEIDVYQKDGGKEGLEEKISTLKKAKSINRVFYQLANKVNSDWGKDKVLAYKKAQQEYGLSDRKKMVEEIKVAQLSLKGIKKLENSKTDIKSRFSKHRSEVFLDNETAKRVHAKVKKQIETRFANAMTTNNIDELKDLKKVVGEVRTQFAAEGRKENTGVEKYIFKDDEFKDVEFLGVSKQDLDKIESFFDKKIEDMMKVKFEKLVQHSSIDRLEDNVTQYFKQTEFAGMNRAESAKKVYEMFYAIKEKLGKKSNVAIKLSMILSKVEHLTV